MKTYRFAGLGKTKELALRDWFSKWYQYYGKYEISESLILREKDQDKTYWKHSLKQYLIKQGETL